MDTHDKPRSQRSPDDYADQIIDAVANYLIALGRYKNEDEFTKALFADARNFASNGITADDLYARISQEGSIPSGAIVDNNIAWAMFALLYCIEAIAANMAGEVTTAWTLIVNARFAADAVLSQVHDIHAAAASRKIVARVGASVRLANDPKQAAKAGALELWKERHTGKHPRLRTVEQYATEVMRRWPVLESAKVICGWSANWTKTMKEGKTPAC